MTHDYLTFDESIDVVIERLDGKRYSLKECGIGVRDLEVSSPYYMNTSEILGGTDGYVDLGTRLGYRQIKMSLYFVAESVQEYTQKRDEVFLFLDSREPFYIIESRNPFKRWKVKVDGIFTPNQERILGFFDVNLVSFSPFGESVGSTLNPGQFLQVRSNESVKYVFNQPSFSVWNDGDIAVDPREKGLKITFVGVSENLIIRNLTTEDEWNCNGVTDTDDIIVLEGVRSLRNGSSIFGTTNRKLISLAPGMNQFEIVGALDPFEISFDFRFYYI